MPTRARGRCTNIQVSTKKNIYITKKKKKIKKGRGFYNEASAVGVRAHIPRKQTRLVHPAPRHNASAPLKLLEHMGPIPSPSPPPAPYHLPSSYRQPWNRGLTLSRPFNLHQGALPVDGRAGRVFRPPSPLLKAFLALMLGISSLPARLKGRKPWAVSPLAAWEVSRIFFFFFFCG